jgi:hypothetical protein
MLFLLFAASLPMQSLMTNDLLLMEVKKMNPAQVDALLQVAAECFLPTTDGAYYRCIPAVKRAQIKLSSFPIAKKSLTVLWKTSLQVGPYGLKAGSSQFKKAMDDQQDARQEIEDTLTDYFSRQ